MVIIAARPARAPLSKAELIGMVAALMALNAFAIDIMLPALPDIGNAFGAMNGNERQLTVIVYVFGFGVAQLFYGPLADAWGRRGVLLGAMAAFIAATVLCVLAQSFEAFIAGRLLQGVAAAATRVIAMAVVRDLMSGRRMAEVVSFAMTIFMAAPILAPAVGQLILFTAPWRWIFLTLLLGAAAIFAWAWLRLPETLKPEDRLPLRPASTARSYASALTARLTLGYTAASSLIFGALFAFIAASEQVLAEQYGLGPAFVIAFAGVALGMSATNFINGRLVRRLGMRRLSHGALIAFTALSVLHAALTLSGAPPFWLFYALLTLTMVLFGLIGANFSALVMEPAGHNAGVTAAVYGSATSIFGAILGGAVGMAYDGSALPLVGGMAALGAGALVAVLITERGRLFFEGDAAEEA
ncbi:MAG: multidrug effflux MFS transporter [Maricaulaceae bacterium]|nr:multidrug effflux MFS transporter [Maricaulaceae bacterium]